MTRRAVLILMGTVVVLGGCIPTGARRVAQMLPGDRIETIARIQVAKGCPASLAHDDDVRNDTGAGTGRLLPAPTPTGALVCEYSSQFDGAALQKEVRLDAAHAAELAAVIAGIDLKPDLGVHGCPDDRGVNNIMTFSYAGRSDVGLWWHASGCQSLDNGVVTAYTIANPSFYDRFASFVGGLS